MPQKKYIDTALRALNITRTPFDELNGNIQGFAHGREFLAGINTLGRHCPYCQMKCEEHLLSCQAAALREKLSPFLDNFGEPTGAEANRDVFNLVLTARELVLGLDGFDPYFSIVSLSHVQNLKEKLAPFESVK